MKNLLEEFVTVKLEEVSCMSKKLAKHLAIATFVTLVTGNPVLAALACAAEEAAEQGARAS